MSQETTSKRRERVDAIIEEYLLAADRGTTADWRDVVSQYPEFADELQAFFADHEQLDRIGEPVRPKEPTRALRSPMDVSPTRVFGSGPLPPVTEPPKRFHDYEIEGEIARGGMGVVYKARQISANRVVALKMILGGRHAEREDLLRFRAEAEATANLDHPNIVPIHEVGEYEGQPYFSMKWIDGGSLQQRIKEASDKAAFAPRDAVVLMARVARAVHYAHERGILHRDLKPGNILLQEGARSQRPEARIKAGSPPGSWLLAPEFLPYVTDFGLAKRMSGDSDLTESGAIVGTPNYMSPEQASGSKSLTTATDTYSLGAIFYELLTKRKPFQAEAFIETLRLVREQEPEKPRHIDPSIPRDLETICLKCLEKDPANRYPSALAFAEDLERWLGGEPIFARRVSTSERFVKWLRRHPALAATILLVSASWLTASVLITCQWQETRQARDAERDERTRAEAALADSERSLRRANIMLYANLIERANREIDAGRFIAADQFLEESATAERGWEWRYLKACCRPIARYGPFRTPTFRPDGKRWAGVERETGHVCIFDCETGKEVARIRPDASITEVRFSPDSTLLAGAGKQSFLWNGVSGEVVRKWESPSAHIAWSPDSKRVAYADSTVRVFDREGEAGPVIDLKERPLALALTEDRVVAAQSEGVSQWDLSSGESKRLLDVPLKLAAFSADGKLFAGSSKLRDIEIWTLDDLEKPVLVPAGNPNVRLFEFDRAGPSLLFVTSDGVVSLYDRQTGGRPRTWMPHALFPTCAAMSGDGRLILSGNLEEARLWRKDDLPKPSTHDTNAQTPSAASMAGNRIAMLGQKTWTVWDVSREKCVSRGTLDIVPIAMVGFDGSGLALGKGSVWQVWNVAPCRMSHEIKTNGKVLGVQHVDGRFVGISLEKDRLVLRGVDGKILADCVATGKETKALVMRTGEGEFRFVVRSPGWVHMIDVKSGKPIYKFTVEEPALDFFSVTPDGRYAVWNANRHMHVAAVQFLSADADRPCRDIVHPADNVGSVTLSTDGKRLATQTFYGHIRLFDTQTGQQLCHLQSKFGHYALLSSDGASLAAVGRGGQLEIWTMPPGR